MQIRYIEHNIHSCITKHTGYCFSLRRFKASIAPGVGVESICKVLNAIKQNIVLNEERNRKDKRNEKKIKKNGRGVNNSSI